MRTTRKESNTFLTHTFGRGLEDERFAIERFKSTMDGEIRSVSAVEAKAGGGRKRKRATATRKAVREMRPARDEIIVCTGLRTRDSGVQYWGVYSIGLFGKCRQR
ncbi:MAG: hypothetical protein OXL41_08400 [Nitrospinae bacterium]|nr:hypothetical protein [Nitrospinota bacterium]